MRRWKLVKTEAERDNKPEGHILIYEVSVSRPITRDKKVKQRILCLDCRGKSHAVPRTSQQHSWATVNLLHAKTSDIKRRSHLNCDRLSEAIHDLCADLLVCATETLDYFTSMSRFEKKKKTGLRTISLAIELVLVQDVTANSLIKRSVCFKSVICAFTLLYLHFLVLLCVNLLCCHLYKIIILNGTINKAYIKSKIILR